MFLNILKISRISLFWTVWKRNWLSLASWALFILKLHKAFQRFVKSWSNFDLNFSFKFPYNFTAQLKKLKLVMVVIKSFDKYYHFTSTFTFWILFAKLKTLHGILRGQFPPWKWSHPFVACTPYDNFKISPKPYALPSPSYKYDNYDKTTYKVSSYC